MGPSMVFEAQQRLPGCGSCASLRSYTALSWKKLMSPLSTGQLLCTRICFGTCTFLHDNVTSSIPEAALQTFHTQDTKAKALTSPGTRLPISLREQTSHFPIQPPAEAGCPSLMAQFHFSLVH
ncbi:hypothetical protein P7K49_008999 [Saguinus oedipus]|uniref:Uncharacterized protein n=1 Tax=Saguinus oedipus TaxID=9490 RepID=A0ABQ9VZC7_SAGOE|nr:hypothetical protein P7K49_008999 [Saguinus oedipus]